MDPVKEKKPPQIEIVADEDRANEDVIVETEKKLEAAEQKRSGYDPDAVEKLHRRMEYQARQFEKGMSRIESIAQNLQSLQTNPSPQPKAEDMDELDQIAQNDWKEAVRRLGREAAQKLWDEKQAELKNQQESFSKASELDHSKQRVLERYPNLSDENSEEAQIYIQVTNEDPSILKNPKGPELAMYRMEERLRQLGKNPPEIRKEMDSKVESEVQRRTRIGAGSLPVGRQSNQSNRLVITQKDKEFCDRLGIPYDRYLANRSLIENNVKEGVEVE